MTHRPMEWPKKGTLAQKVAAGRSAKAHLSIAQDAGAQARMRGEKIESNPYSTTNGPVEHRLAVGWFQSWIRYDKGLAQQGKLLATTNPTQPSRLSLSAVSGFYSSLSRLMADLTILSLAFLAYIALLRYNHWRDWRDMLTFIEENLT